jgi:hypothetical protein
VDENAVTYPSAVVSRITTFMVGGFPDHEAERSSC